MTLIPDNCIVTTVACPCRDKHLSHCHQPPPLSPHQCLPSSLMIQPRPALSQLSRHQLRWENISVKIFYSKLFQSEPPMVLAYNEIISTNLALYLRNSAAIGSLVSRQASMVETLFQLQRQFLLSSCRGNLPNAGSGPSQAEFITKIQKFAMENVRIYFNSNPFLHFIFIRASLNTENILIMLPAQSQLWGGLSFRRIQPRLVQY